MVGGDLRLHREHRLGVEVDSRQFRHAPQVREILLPYGGVRLFAVERLVGKPDAGLEEVHDVAVGLRLVREDFVADDAADSRHLQGADRAGEFVVGARGVHGGEVFVDRLRAQGVDRVRVHETRIEGAGEFLTRGLLDDGAHVLLCLVVKSMEGAVGRPVVGNLVGLQPRSVDVTEEVVLWSDRVGQGRGVDAALSHVPTLGGGATRGAKVSLMARTRCRVS